MLSLSIDKESDINLRWLGATAHNTQPDTHRKDTGVETKETQINLVAPAQYMAHLVAECWYSCCQYTGCIHFIEESEIKPTVGVGERFERFFVRLYKWEHQLT